MSDSVLNQMRNKRNRTTVPERVDALVNKVQQPENSVDATTPATDPQPPEQSIETDLSLPESGDTISALTAELSQYPETKRHSAIVLEKDLDQKLTQFCKDRGITVETFLEAAWMVTSADSKQLEKIAVEAKRRYDQRKRVGQLKRLITMLGNSSKF